MTLNKAAIVPREVKEAFEDYGHESVTFNRYESTGMLKAQISSGNHICFNAFELTDFDIFMVKTFSSGRMDIVFQKKD